MFHLDNNSYLSVFDTTYNYQLHLSICDEIDNTQMYVWKIYEGCTIHLIKMYPWYALAKAKRNGHRFIQ